MKKILSILVLLLVTIAASAQIPYFGSSNGKGKVYTYFQFKCFPGVNTQSFYTAEGYGLTKNIDLDFNYNSADNTMGFGGKYSFIQHHNVNVAIQPMVSFDLNNNFNFYYVNTGLFINGYLAGPVSYILNTWWTAYNDKSHWLEEWYYLGVDVGKVTLLVGGVSDLLHEFKTDLAVGLWFPIASNSYVYVWGGNLTNSQGRPKVTVGIDYKF